MTAKNIYFRPVKKKCECGESRECMSIGEYMYGKWRTVRYCCEKCVDNLKNDVKLYETRENRLVNLVGYQGSKKPNWLEI